MKAVVIPAILAVVLAGAGAAFWTIGKSEQRMADAQNIAAKAREEERQRIASDFHDGPLQNFISLQMRLEILRKVLDRNLEAGLEDLKDLQELAQRQVGDLRTFLHSMRPVDVDGANLVSTARRTAEMFQKESGIPVTFLGTNMPVAPRGGQRRCCR